MRVFMAPGSIVKAPLVLQIKTVFAVFFNSIISSDPSVLTQPLNSRNSEQSGPFVADMTSCCEASDNHPSVVTESTVMFWGRLANISLTIARRRPVIIAAKTGFEIWLSFNSVLSPVRESKVFLL